MHQLHPDEIVTVSFPSRYGRHDVVEFHVVTVIDSVIALDPIDRSGMRQVPSRVRDCYMTCGQGRELVGFKGHLYERAPGDWRFKLVDSLAVTIGRRGDIRLSAPITITDCAPEAGGEPITAQTVQIGADRILITGEEGWSAPLQSRIALTLPGQDELIDATVKLVMQQGKLAEFGYEVMEGEVRNRLAAFLIEDKRTTLARHRAWARAGAGLDDDIDFWAI